MATLYAPVSFWDHGLPCDLESLMYLKRAVAFQVFQDFSCCEDENDHLELFTYQNRNHPCTCVALYFSLVRWHHFHLLILLLRVQMGGFRVFILWSIHLKTLSCWQLCIWISFPQLIKIVCPEYLFVIPKTFYTGYLLFYHCPFGSKINNLPRMILDIKTDVTTYIK